MQQLVETLGNQEANATDYEHERGEGQRQREEQVPLLSKGPHVGLHPSTLDQ